MLKADIKIGKVYAAKVSGSISPVRIDSESHYKGWVGTNLATKREVRIRGAARLRFEIFNVDGKWVSVPPR